MFKQNNKIEVSEVELIYKRKHDIKQSPRIITSKDAYDVLIEHWDENKIDFIEQAKVLLLNRAHNIIGIFEVSTGGIAGTIVDPKLVFTAALKVNASSIVLAHNHPSGNIQPSQADNNLTRKFKEAGKLLDINVADHLIIARSGNYYSFSDDYPF